jgi:uncharacterized protein YgiM (DUF1202 family)
MLLRFLGIFLTLMITLIEPVFAQAQSSFVGRVISDRVYVRSGQNVNFETVATTNKNDTLIVLAKSYGWLKVKLPAQAKGFIKAEYVELLSPEVGTVKADRVNVRCAPNTVASIIGKLERGNRFYIWGKEGDWVSIKPLDQFVGWVKEEFVEPKRGAAVPAVLYPEPPAFEKVPPVVEKTPTAVEKTSPAAVVPVWSTWLKKLANGQVETSGLLKKEGGRYLVLKNNETICSLQGPADVLDRFVGSQVKVRGAVVVGVNAQEPVVSISKINFVL